MLTGIDHIVILVPNLANGIRDYEGLGFTVVPGGEHPGGTHNALIAFADGAYIELIAFQDPNATGHRWHQFLATGGGLVDFALGTTDLAAEVARLNPTDSEYADFSYRIADGARTRPDGVQIQWRSASGLQAGQLPFLIEDVTPRGLRVPSGTDIHHANTVTGVLSITVAVRDLATAQQRFGQLLEAIPLTQRDNAELHARTATYVIGQHTIELAQPIDARSPLDAYLSARGYVPMTEAQREITNGGSAGRRLSLGGGPYSACLTADPGPASAQWLDQTAANGARLQIVATKARG
jgi:catechol 2,3-dioxygenase-like lactoylglutathione lyase family enzyme